MRSRTSRGVPEWSGGKELYIGSAVLAIGTSFGVIGIVPGPPEGSRGSTRWGHLPRWATWALGGAPWPVWAKGNQPQRAHAPRVPSRRSPRWIRHLLDGLGGRETSLAAAPLGDWISQGRRPPPRGLYKGGQGRGAAHPLPWRLPLSLQHLLLLRRAWRSPVGVLQLHHHHAVVLLLELSSPTSPSPLLDQEEGDVTLTVRVLNAEVPSVRH